MVSNTSKYKNIDKSTHLLLENKDQFISLNFSNETNKIQYLKFAMIKKYIQFYFSLYENSSVSFGFEHCRVSLKKNDSCFVYFKDSKMDLLIQVNPKTTLLVLLFEIPYFHSLFSNEQNNNYQLTNIGTEKQIIENKPMNLATTHIVEQITSKSYLQNIKSLYIKGKILELLSNYFQFTEEDKIENCPFMANEQTVAKIKKVKDIVIENMNQPPSLNQLSKSVGLNVKKIKLGFKEQYGAPVFTFLLQYKMEQSKKLLLKNELNVNEIAIKIGYSSSSHFIAAFKKYFGITPKQFSKQEL